MRTVSVRIFGLRRLLLLSLAAPLFTFLPPTPAGAQGVNTKVSGRPAAAAKKPAPAPPAAPAQKFVREGIRVDFSLQPVDGSRGGAAGLAAGTDALATFRVTDANTGHPLTGLRPNAWVSSRRSPRPAGEGECKDKIRSFMGGLLSVRADYDLNSYFVLTLNHDNTVSFINPLVAFKRTKLESLVVLPGAGADWVLSKDKESLYVTLPEQSAVAVVSTVSRKLVRLIPVGEKEKPTRITLDPDGRFAWVGLDGSPRVAVLDTHKGELAATVTAGRGLHQIAFTPDGRFAYVTNSADDTVTALDARSFTKLADIRVGGTPVPVAYGGAARQLYVASVNGEHVTVVDPERRRVAKTIPVKRGVVALRFEPSGRYAFAVNQVESTVSVIDTATNAVVGTSAVVKGPDQITFTRNYAYVRGTGSEKFSLIELSAVGKGRVSPVDVQAGQKPPSALPGEIGVADMIAPTPEGNAAMIANAPDSMLYYYVEGMMAPVGTLSNYKRRPRALLILDRSLAEVAPGVYSAPVRLNKAGRFDVPFMLSRPRVVNCFDLEVADSPHAERARGVAVKVEALFKGKEFKAGEPVSLRFKVSDPATGRPVEALSDVRVLVFEPPGIWQERRWATAVGPGLYETTLTFPRSGLYNVLVAIESRGVSLGDLPFTAVPVNEGTKASAGAN